jgi:uncharacterized protein involved in outer membrane biogenesis
MTTIRKHLSRAAGIVLAASLLVVAAAWLWMATLDLQAQRGRIETAASRMLGRAVHIDGPLSLSPSLFPRVSLADVHIANPGWAAQPDFLAVRQLEVEINPWALLRNRIEIRDVELAGVAVHLQRGPDQDATWYFKPGTKQGSAPGNIPDIAALHAADVRIIYYPADRPPLDIGIDELQASLERDQPVSISTKGNIRGFPLGIELQGGSLAGLFAPGKRWPLRGSLNTAIQNLDFDGYLTDTSAAQGLELRISSDLQQQRDPLLTGRPVTPLLDRYQLNLSVHKQAKTYLAKLSGGFDGFDLSRIYRQDRRQQLPALKIRGFRIEAQGSGATFSQIMQSIAIDATGSGMEYQHPLKDTVRKPYTARFETFSARSRGDSGFKLLAQGTSGDVPVQLRASARNALYALWQRRDVAFVLDIQAKAARGHFAGRLIAPLKQIALDGQAAVKADDWAMIGALAGRKWPASAALAATSAVSFKDRTLRFSAIRGRLGSQAIDGDFALGFDHGIGLAINAHTGHFDIHDVTRQGQASGKLVLGLNDMDLGIQGQGDTFMQSLLTGVWQITAASGRVGWLSRDSEHREKDQGGYVAALHDIRFDTHGQQPATLAATGLYNDVEFKLDAQAGPLGELPDQVQPYPLDLHLSAKGLSGSFQGDVRKPLADIALAGNLEIEGRLPVLGRLIHASLARDQAADLRGHLAMTRGDVKLTGIVARTDGVVANGELDYQPAKSPRLTITSSGSSIDLAPYLQHQTKPEQNRAASRPLDSLIVPDVALDFAKRRALDAVVTIKDLKVGYQDKPITLIDARFSARDGVYRLDPLQSRSAINDAAILARIEIDGSSDPAAASLALQADNFDFGEIIKRLGISNDVAGTLTLRVDAKGKGRDLRKLIASANGKVQLVADRGSIPKWALEIWGSGLVRLIIPTTWTEDPVTELNCAVARFELTDGVMRSQTLLADTKRVTVAGEAVVNWKNEEIHALFKPQPKDPTLFHLGTPIQLGGTLAHPSVGSAQSGIVSLGKWAIGLTSPAALIVVFGNVGTKEKNPCAALLKETARD